MIITFDFLEQWNFQKLLPDNVRSDKVKLHYKIFKKN